jgi:hypothetical protein
MIQVALLTEQQKNELLGQQYANDNYFNPIQDIDDNWIISMEEINASDIPWLKELSFIDYVAKPLPEPKTKATELPSE